MPDLTFFARQTVDLPNAPFQAHHFINGEFADCADCQKSDRVSPSIGDAEGAGAKVSFGGYTLVVPGLDQLGWAAIRK